MLISGKCHCGNISFSLTWQPDPTEILANVCSCSFCTKHGAVWTTCPSGSLKVTVKETTLVSKYAFETKTAHFHICSRCGVVPVVTSEIEGRLYAVVSVNALEGVEPSLIRRVPRNFGGESTEDRLERRQRHWIADVEYVESGS